MKRYLIPAAGLVAAAFLVGSPVARAAETETSLVTFNKDVAPVLYQNCVECHRPGEAAPMSLLTYKDARPWARSIRDKVASREMPPWLADPKHGEFANDRRLSQKDVDTILAWVNRGAPEGDAKDLPKAPAFVDGWNIGTPDAVIKMAEAFEVPSDGVVAYKNFVVPTNFTEDKWVVAAELRPGVRSVVHHIIAFSQKPDGTDRKLLVGYAPGEQASVMPKGLGRKIPAGANIVFQVHYTPNGTAAKDQSYLGLMFAKETPKQEMMTRGVMNTRFVIPAGDPGYQVASTYTFNEDSHIHAMMPHMHYRGKDFEYKLTYPDGTSKVILSVPRYDFGWQLYYFLKEPVAAPKGTRLDCLAHFDNSTQNKYNPDPAKEVRWGDQTWEEMMIGWTSYTVDAHAKPAPPATDGAAPAAQGSIR
jgi:mono/diheme cytochrome c family protein